MVVGEVSDPPGRLTSSDRPRRMLTAIVFAAPSESVFPITVAAPVSATQTEISDHSLSLPIPTTPLALCHIFRTLYLIFNFLNVLPRHPSHYNAMIELVTGVRDK